MTRLCIPAPTVNKMKQALVDGKLSVKDLYEMTSAQRRAKFGEYVPEELAQFVNLKFEKAMVSRKKTAITEFLKEITTAEDKKMPRHKNLLDKVADLKEEDLLDSATEKAVLEDLVADRLGISVSAEEIKTICEKCANLERLKDSLYDKDGLPTEDYFAALVDMDKYINSLTPTHNLKVLTGQIGRGNMLLNIPPAVVNTLSNAVQGVMQAAERRMAGNQYKGANSGFAIKYAKRAIQIFHNTGFDISRMYAEDMRLGEHIVHSEGPGIIRAIGRAQSKLVFKYMLGYSDVASASIASADSMALQTAKIAKQMGLTGDEANGKALEILKDAIQLAPKTKEGQIVREQAIADAEYATWTNKGFVANAAMKFRDWLNDTTGDLQLGYWNIPFVKTGANVLQFGLESTPIGSVSALAKLPKAIKAMHDKVSPDIKPMQEVIRLAVRSGMGMTLAMILANLIEPDDFVGAYEALNQKQRDQMGLQNGVYNAVKIGNKWISLDYFGALGSGFVGMMYAKKYGKGLINSTHQFSRGVLAQSLQIPGIKDFVDLWNTLIRLVTKKDIGNAVDVATGTVNSIRSRVIPGIVNTIAKATDDKERKAENVIDRTKAGIPGLRQTLPAKIDQTTGDEVKGEGFWSNMLFASRVKTANESALIDEIVRLDSVNLAPAIADIARSSSQVKELKAQISTEKYQEAEKYYGKTYGDIASKVIAVPSYKNATDEDKQKLLNKIRDKARGAMLKKFGYVKNKGLQ